MLRKSKQCLLHKTGQKRSPLLDCCLINSCWKLILRTRSMMHKFSPFHTGELCNCLLWAYPMNVTLKTYHPHIIIYPRVCSLSYGISLNDIFINMYASEIFKYNSFLSISSNLTKSRISFQYHFVSLHVALMSSINQVNLSNIFTSRIREILHVLYSVNVVWRFIFRVHCGTLQTNYLPEE